MTLQDASEVSSDCIRVILQIRVRRQLLISLRTEPDQSNSNEPDDKNNLLCLDGLLMQNEAVKPNPTFGRNFMSGYISRL